VVFMEWESNILDITERYQEHGDHILHSQRHPQSLSGGLQGRTASVSRAGQCDGNVAGEIQFIRLSLAPSGHQVRKWACVFGVVRKVGESRMWWVAVPFPMCCHDWQSLPLCGPMALTSIWWPSSLTLSFICIFNLLA